jgi:hypothetical protein
VEGRCDSCEAGKYSRTSSGEACTRCAAGRFSEVVGSVSEDDCVECEEGKVSYSGATACSRIVGAKVHVAMGRPGSNAEAREVAVWTGEIEAGAPEYTFEPTSEITC